MHAVFLRAVNVAGHQNVSVGAIAKKLGYANVGAAGTFVARSGSGAAVRKAVAAELPFDTEIMVLPGEAVRALVEAAPLAKKEGRPFVSVLAKKPTKLPALPIEEKAMRLVAVEGTFALSVVLPEAKPGANVNALVEKTLGVPATTRAWSTLAKVAQALDA